MRLAKLYQGMLLAVAVPLATYAVADTTTANNSSSSNSAASSSQTTTTSTSSQSSTTNQASSGTAQLSTIVVEGQRPTPVPGTTSTTVNPNQTIYEIFKNTPGVSLLTRGNDVLEGVVIRGIGGGPTDYGTGAGRVALTLDGISLPTSYKFGHEDLKGVEYFETANLAGADVERGPSFNNNTTGVAGSVNLRTREPSDIIRKGRWFGAEFKSSYDRRYKAWFTNYSGAFQVNNQLQALVSYTKRHTNEVQTPDWFTQKDVPVFSRTNHNFHTKWIWDVTENHRLSVTFDNFRSLYATPMQRIQPLWSLPRDEQKTSPGRRWYVNIQGKHYFETPFLDAVTWNYGRSQTYSNLELYMKNLLPIPNGNYYLLNRTVTHYYTNITQGNLELAKRIYTGTLQHNFTFGGHVSKESLINYKQNYTDATLPSSSTVTNNYSSFVPGATRHLWSVFLADKVKYQNFTFTPSFKYAQLRSQALEDSYKSVAKGSNGDLYKDTSTYKYRAFNWGLLTTWQLNKSHQLSLNIVQATRFPTVTEIHPATYFHDEFHPNYDLKPEKSRGVTLGWSFRSAVYDHNLDLSYTRFKDMISTWAKTHYDEDWQEDLVDYRMPVNRKNPVNVYAVEYTGTVKFGGIYQALEGWELQAALAWAHGRDKTDNTPITGIMPLSGNLELSYSQQYYKAFARLNFAARKSINEIGFDEVYGGQSKPIAGWSTWDLGITFTPIKELAVNVTLYNFGNRTYQLWDQVYKGVGSNRNIYTQPGRSYALSLDYKF